MVSVRDVTDNQCLDFRRKIYGFSQVKEGPKGLYDYFTLLFASEIRHLLRPGKNCPGFGPDPGPDIGLGQGRGMSQGLDQDQEAVEG